MESKATNLNSLQAKAVELEKTSSMMALGEVFNERKGSYLNEFTLFLAHFNAIPNFINEINIDCKKASKRFGDNYKGEIRDFHFFKRYFGRTSGIPCLFGMTRSHEPRYSLSDA